MAASLPLCVRVELLTRGCSFGRSAHGSPSSVAGRWHARACSTTAACSYLLNYNSLGIIEVPLYPLVFVLVCPHLVHETLSDYLVRCASQIAGLLADLREGYPACSLVHVLSRVNQTFVILAANRFKLESFRLTQILRDPRSRPILNKLIDH